MYYIEWKSTKPDTSRTEYYIVWDSLIYNKVSRKDERMVNDFKSHDQSFCVGLIVECVNFTIKWRLMLHLTYLKNCFDTWQFQLSEDFLLSSNSTSYYLLFKGITKRFGFRKGTPPTLLQSLYSASIQYSNGSGPPGSCSITYSNVPDTKSDIWQSLERRKDETPDTFCHNIFVSFKMQTESFTTG